MQSITRGAVFRHIRRGGHVQSDRLTTVSARRIIQKRAHAAGVEGFISGHSLAGRICGLARTSRGNRRRYAGRRTLEILAQMPAHYAKAELAERGAQSHGSRTESRDNQHTHRSQVVASGYNTQNVPSTSESTFSAGVTCYLPRVDRNRCQSQHVHRNRFYRPNRRHDFC